MQIVINEGYEYRPFTDLIGQDGFENSFFCESYCRALEIIEKYEKTLRLDAKKNEQLLGKNERTERNKVKNVLIISSNRGQGKTTALYSVCKYLCDENRPQVSRLSDKMAFYDVSRRYHRIRDVIDPSSMNEGESIIRTILSRLFDEINERILFDDLKLKVNEQEELNILFHKCYTDIDVLMGNRRRDSIYDQDSLDALSELGDSGNLRNNIKELVSKFLKVLYGSDQNRTLLIPIDDTDLAIDGALKICEDIKNILSVENVLVIMAADMDQLENAIEQKYFKQYEFVIRSQEGHEKQTYMEKCREMATRYIEKVFPDGYRVELAKFNNALKTNYNLTLIYRDEDGKEKGIFQGELSLYKKLCKVLYERTGMIFMAGAIERNGLLPSTFRELTHFVKLLDELETISSDRLFIYENTMLTEISKDEIGKILRNIGRIKQYFIVNWLPLHSTESVQKELEEKAEQPINVFKKEIQAVYKISTKKVSTMPWEQLRGLFELTDWYINNHEVKTKYNKYDEAIKIYYTIALNELYYQLIMRHEEKEITKLLVDSFQIADKLGTIGYYALYVYKFSCEDALVKNILYQDGVMPEDKKEWMDYYCDSNGHITVDIFKFFIKALANPYMLLENDSKGISSKEIMPQSTEDIQSPDIRTIISNGSSRIIAVRNMLLNYDIQEKLSSIIRNELLKNGRNADKNALMNVYSQMASRVEDWIKTNVDFADFDSSVVNYALCKGNTFCGEFLLCNQYNRNRLVEIIKERLVPQYRFMVSRLNKCTSSEMARDILTARVDWDTFVDKEVLLNCKSGLKDDLLDSEIAILQQIEEEINAVKAELDNNANEENLLKKVDNLLIKLNPLIEMLKT